MGCHGGPCYYPFNSDIPDYYHHGCHWRSQFPPDFLEDPGTPPLAAASRNDQAVSASLESKLGNIESLVERLAMKVAGMEEKMEAGDAGKKTELK